MPWCFSGIAASLVPQSRYANAIRPLGKWIGDLEGRCCGANEEFGEDVNRNDMTCTSYGLQNSVWYVAYSLVLSCFELDMQWYELAYVRWYYEARSSVLKITAQQDKFGFNSYQEAANTLPNCQIVQSLRPCPDRGNVHTGVLNAQVFEGTGQRFRLLRFFWVRDLGCHSVSEPAKKWTNGRMSRGKVVPSVLNSCRSLHRKCTERPETVRLLQQAAESVLAVVGTGLARFAVFCWVDFRGSWERWINFKRFGCGTSSHACGRSQGIARSYRPELLKMIRWLGGRG